MQESRTGRMESIGSTPVSHRVVTEAETLTANDVHIVAEIPLASANDYTITLPPLSARPWQEILVTVRRASGTYVNGGVQLSAGSDGYKAAGLTNDKLTTAGDFWHVRNVGGLWWQEIAELTT